jgi:hypothetical protein
VLTLPASSVTSLLDTFVNKAAQGTVLYLGLYIFCLIPFQSFSKFYILDQKKNQAKKDQTKERPSFREVKYYNSKDKLALLGDRTVGNFLEFAILFLPLLWIHAVFVDHTQSFTICALYTASRALYPIVFGMGLPWIGLSTIPGYLVYFYLLFDVGTKFAFA